MTARSSHWMQRAIAASLLALAWVTCAYGQIERGTVALVNARIVTVTKGIIERGTIIIRDDRIHAVGSSLVVPDSVVVVDCSGLTVYPGFIDGGTQIGLVEIGSLPETRDENEIGEITPHMYALTAVNPNSATIPVTRVSGVTTVLTMPTGGLLPGTAAMIDLVGYTPKQMYAGFNAVLLTFPATVQRRGRRQRAESGSDSAAQRARARLDEIFDRAVLMSRLDSTTGGRERSDHSREYVPEIAALTPVVRRELPLLIEVNGSQDIDSAIAWVRRRNIRAIFAGVAEGWRVADHLADADIPCIVGPILSLPNRPSDRYDKPYANAGLLHQAGVRLCIRSNETSNARNLPFHAGFAAAYGLGRDAALRSITIDAAEIFGIDREVGSIEEGKLANLFVADGDPFEPSTSVLHVFIRGYRVPMESRHIDLYHEFLDRKPGLSR